MILALKVTQPPKLQSLSLLPPFGENREDHEIILKELGRGSETRFSLEFLVVLTGFLA